MTKNAGRSKTAPLGNALRENRLGWHGNFCHHAGMRVLIADDQKSVGTSLAEMVRRCQHEVVEVVSSGLEAIHAYGRHHPDVVLMDYQMPKLNGATAAGISWRNTQRPA
jgi:CheY-like chemotaxis protein